ncbi:G2/M phase-specific E3 ubiquitin-protein ligase-like isoform X2 [Colossoma macropomum]|uniref:G2/M phase-specific E3 ubiquitin-protein ligase-like isoform X2 n=1 Tax=Colossoma macropomum TaxID=42526 RepID=UPI001864BD6A|nr:G2/M phase-specific E3 ubiquitin-protein ligase-like isoform X2 [Colossoma macropomum]
MVVVCSCHSKLVKPSLAPHQEMSGRMLKKVFHQRSVYVLPDKVLLDQSSSESGEESPGSEIGSSVASSKSETVVQQDVPHVVMDQQQDRHRIMSDLPEEESNVILISQTGPRETVRTSTLYGEYVNLLEIEEYEPEDASLQEAIANSLSETSFRTVNSDCPTIEDIIRELNQQLNPNEVVRFNIIRRNVWDGATRAMARPNFSPAKTVDVKFTDDHGISEGAVDNGGPTREFFRLCLQEVKDSCGMFEGPPNMKLLSCNSKATRSNWYFLAGQLMAMSIVHGGQSPAFLSPVLFNALVMGPDKVKVTISDVPDVETSQKLQLIKDAKTDKELQEAVFAASCLISLAGCSRKITLTNKEEVCTELAEWYVLQRTRAPFERFRDGLQSLGVLDALQKYPERFQEVFMKTAIPLTATAVEVLFKCKMAERGSNRFDAQCRTLGYWRDYLQDAEVDLEAVTLEEILIFSTGCDSIPPLGFSPLPSLEFEECSAYPTANTCDNILRVPIKTTYEDFKLAMDFGIRNAAGFGKA